MQRLKRELLIYFAVLVVLALIQHPDLLVSPIDRIAGLPGAIVYGMGAFHPFGFALIGYLLVKLIAGIFGLFRRLFTV